MTMAGRRREGRSPGGFSLLEVSVTLAVGGVTLALSFALWSGAMRERRVVRVAEEVAGLVRYAQQAAVADSVDTCHYGVTFAGGRAQVRKTPRDPNTGTCAAPGPPVRVSDPFPSGVSAAVAPPQEIEFYPSGSANATFTILVSAGGPSRTVDVDGATGRAEVRP